MIFRLLSVDDWQALYVDGKLVAQNHSVDLVHYLGLHGVDIEEDDVTGWFDDNELSEFPMELPNYEDS